MFEQDYAKIKKTIWNVHGRDYMHAWSYVGHHRLGMPINKTHQKTFDPHATPTPSLCLVIFVYLLISMPRHLYLSSCRGPKFTESLFPMFLVIKFWHQYWH